MQFFCGQVRLLLKRCQILRTYLAEPVLSTDQLPEELHPYRTIFDNLLYSQEEQIQRLLDDLEVGDTQIQLQQLVDFHDYTRNIDRYEFIPLPLLDHYCDRDYYLYKFTQLLCDQIGYPRNRADALPIRPLACAHSSDYFYSFGSYLVCIPVFEDQFLLVIPDLVHELGHTFFALYKNRARGMIFDPFLKLLQEYIDHQKNRLKSIINSVILHNYKKNLDRLEDAWSENYLGEFAADMFATYLVGPAYGWSHLRLMLANGSQLYYPGFGETHSHPSDEARMRGILFILKLLRNTPSQASSQITILEKEWEKYKKTLMKMMKYEPQSGYRHCYPDDLLQTLAQLVISMCERSRLKRYYEQERVEYNIPFLMQIAWDKFHQNPINYHQWETEQVRNLEMYISNSYQP